MPEERIRCYTPTPGKQPTTIHLWKYMAVRDAILQVVPKEPPGIEAQDLPGLVAAQLSEETLGNLGSVPWYTTTVRLHMEVDGELVRVAGLMPQHIIRGE
ncbi:MAG: hypothetical protein HKN13_04680 [Rhodothermales bacterium]|nr:hypothetical protein [Rhodothermales bacterium]